MQCAAVITRSPAGLSTTLAVQKCWPSLPAAVVNSAPTAGVPPNAWASREGPVRCRTARAKPVAMSPVCGPASRSQRDDRADRKRGEQCRPAG